MAATTDELLQLTLDIDHPDCWTLRVTAGSDAGLLGHGMVGGIGTGKQFGVYTVYGDSEGAIQRLLERIESTHLTDRVSSVSTTMPLDGGVPGRASQPILVEFDPDPSIRAAFADRGFLHCGPSIHEKGKERRRFLAWADRGRLNTALDEIEAAYDADVDISRVTTADATAGGAGVDQLTPRQRQAFRLARDNGYYEYPRATTARALAAELDISKTTYLEHLRKAEAKLFRSIDDW